MKKSKHIDHSKHQVSILPGKGPHAGKIYCLKCQKHVQWLKQSDYEKLIKT